MSAKAGVQESYAYDVIAEDEKFKIEGSPFKTPEGATTPDSFTTKTLSSGGSERTIFKGDFVSEINRQSPEITLALIKPDGIAHLKKIDKIIRAHGFDIIQERFLELSFEQASNFYCEHFGKPYFPYLVATMCEGPIKVYILHKKNAVEEWKVLCGPTSVEEAQKKWPNSLRAIFGTTGKESKNVCHASATHEKALEEIKFFFPNLILEYNLNGGPKIDDYLKECVYPTLLEGLVQLCKNKPVDPLLWLADWLLKNNPYKPRMTERITLTPT